MSDWPIAVATGSHCFASHSAIGMSQVNVTETCTSSASFEKGRSFADTYQLVGWRSIRLGWEYSYYPFFHIHFRIIFAAFGDRSIFNNPHVGIVYSSTYLYQPQRDHFLQYGTKSGEGLGKPRFQHKSVAYDPERRRASCL